MHIPDGFLDAKTYLTAYAVSGTTLAVATNKLKEQFDDRMIPYTGVMAAFIFAGQMVNFPIIGGTSGHLLGAALATIALGPWAASMILSAVLIIQCFFFQDGGLTALGANIVLMGVVAPFVANWVYNLITNHGEREGMIFIGSLLAGWTSVFAASLVCAVMLAFSGQVTLMVALKTMAFWHTFIGLGEGLITAVVVTYLVKVKREVVYGISKGVA